VSNAIIHGYENRDDKQLTLRADLLKDGILLAVEDEGVGITNIAQAMEPSYSQDPERMGLGFAFMQSFTDRLEVDSAPGRGTTVRMFKYFSQGEQQPPCQI
jgi:stage II sporulation protein AB (anti-sigma F factor)